MLWKLNCRQIPNIWTITKKSIFVKRKKTFLNQNIENPLYCDERFPVLIQLV
jgi:hypothetical protein